MILMAAALLAFAGTDLARREGERLKDLRVIGGVLASAASAGGVARLAGMNWPTVGIIATAAFVVLIGWVTLEAQATNPSRAVGALLWVVVALVAAFATSGAVPSMSGPLADWFANLAIRQTKDSAALNQSVLAVAAGLFLMASANRLVRLTLVVAQTSTEKAEPPL